jgi:hypothetical protein
MNPRTIRRSRRRVAKRRDASPRLNQIDVAKPKDAVQQTYVVATNPNGVFHFHRGPDYAVRQLGYDPMELAQLPRSAAESFATWAIRSGCRLPPG